MIYRSKTLKSGTSIAEQENGPINSNTSVQQALEMVFLNNI